MPTLTDEVGPVQTRTFRQDGAAVRSEAEPLPDRNETDLERADRNLVEIPQEVRVAQNGVQVLFGFLLAIAFQSRFREISGFQRINYFVTPPGAGTAAGCVSLWFVLPMLRRRALRRSQPARASRTSDAGGSVPPRPGSLGPTQP